MLGKVQLMVLKPQLNHKNSNNFLNDSLQKTILSIDKIYK